MYISDITISKVNVITKYHEKIPIILYVSKVWSPSLGSGWSFKSLAWQWIGSYGRQAEGKLKKTDSWPVGTERQVDRMWKALLGDIIIASLPGWKLELPGKNKEVMVISRQRQKRLSKPEGPKWAPLIGDVGISAWPRAERGVWRTSPWLLEIL